VAGDDHPDHRPSELKSLIGHRIPVGDDGGGPRSATWSGTWQPEGTVLAVAGGGESGDQVTVAGI
jgi:hypothetical protein